MRPSCHSPFGVPWGILLLGLAAGLFALSLVAGAMNQQLTATIAAMVAVVLGPLGAVLLAAKVIQWATILIVVVVAALLLIGAIVILIRQWRRIANLVADEPNTPATERMVARAKPDSTPPSAAAPSSVES